MIDVDIFEILAIIHFEAEKTGDYEKLDKQLLKLEKVFGKEILLSADIN